MSSIAYITDKNMIEFHRLNGNSTINFWRPTSSKRFTDFHPGDLLFFLAKGTEHGQHKEKGIIGYGRYTGGNTLSFRQMWKRYGALNGYSTSNDLQEAILKVSKSKTLSPLFSCLTLKDVVFFQTPVYPSEIGINISNSLESYIYPDKEDIRATAKILLRANEVGIDVWTAVVSHHAMDATVFDEDLIRHVLRVALERVKDSIDTARESNRITRVLNQFRELTKNQDEMEWIDSRKHEMLKFDSEGVTLTLAFVSLKQDLWRKTMYLVGKTALVKQESSQNLQGKLKRLKIQVVVDSGIPLEIIDCLTQNSIEVVSLPNESNEEKE